MRLFLFCTSLFFAGFLPCASAASPVELIATGSVAADLADRSGLTGILADGNPVNRLGSFGSGIAYTGHDNLYVAVADRGPNATTHDPSIDNTTSYPSRAELFRIQVRSESRTLTIELVDTKLLSDEQGAPFDGLSTRFVADQRSAFRGNRRFDPEAVRVSTDRRFWFVSDEYGPMLYQFDAATGRLARSIDLPEKVSVTRVAANADDELKSNRTGRQPNRGLEGLAITPDGKTLVGIMQGPLLQDGAIDSNGKRVGENIRIVTIDLSNGKTREYVYPLSNGEKNGVNEITAVNNHQFLVHERDGKGGSKAKFKQVFLIDLAQTSDVSNVAELPATGVPTGVTPVSKTLFLDLLDPQFGLASDDFPEKTEGLTFGPDLPDGRHLLIVASDNDFLPTQPTRLFAFAIDPSALPDYQPQQFDKE
jgi:hypothetical protein